MTRALLPVMIGFVFFSPFAAAQPSRRSDDIRFVSGSLQVKHGRGFDVAGNNMPYNMILRDSINFGWCYEDEPYRRMPVTYYHPAGPVGLAFRKFNWWAGAANTYHADARIVASLIGQSDGVGLANFPLSQLTTIWSEPPIAVIGLEAGTPASYARPFQIFDFYEPNKQVVDLNEREEKDRYFHFVADARSRGALVRIFPGEPRELLAKKGPRGFYQLMILEACSGEDGEKIALSLFTKEGIAQCLEHLTDDGVLCVHTSHRFLKLSAILGAIGDALKVNVRRGHDQAPGTEFGRNSLEETGHFTSEWIFLSRSKDTLNAICKAPANYDQLLRKTARLREPYWSDPERAEQVWTDKGPNLLHGVLHGHPFSMRYFSVVRPIADAAAEWAAMLGLNPRWREQIRDLSQLPRPIEQWIVGQQLRYNPQVEKLWK